MYIRVGPGKPRRYRPCQCERSRTLSTICNTRQVGNTVRSLAMLTHPLFGNIDPSVDDFWEAQVKFAGRPVVISVNAAGQVVSVDMES